MGKSSTSFKPGQSGNPLGRAPLSPDQKLARDLRAKAQPKIFQVLYGFVCDDKLEVHDRIAAAKLLHEDLPLEIDHTVKTEGSIMMRFKNSDELLEAIRRTEGK